MHVLDTKVLKLDKNWMPFDTTSVRQAFRDAAAGAATLLRFADGYPIPYRIEDWVNIPVEDKEEFVGVSAGIGRGIKKIAVPRVLICVNFNEAMRRHQKFKKTKKLTTHNVAEVYEGICAVSGKKLKPEEFSKEHVRPLSKGGRNDWNNVVLMDRQLNSKRGNKSYRKIGFTKPKVRREPQAKLLLPINTLVNTEGYLEWDLFKIPRK